MSDMDFVQRSGVKIPNAVIVSGITKSEKDEEVLEFLKKYGGVKTLLPVDDATSEFHQNLIVEYSSGSAVEALEPLMPYKYVAEGEPNVSYCVRALASVYTAKVGEGVTKSYLAELKGLAKLSGKTYEEVLKEMISQICETTENTDEAPSVLHDSIVDETPIPQPQLLSGPSRVSSDQGVSTPVPPLRVQKPSTVISDVNPPEVQKVVVEHILRKDDIGSQIHSSMRIRSFSGKTPRPNNETDYETWRSHIELLLSDPSMTHLQVSRKILENLLPPAVDVVKCLSPSAPPVAYLQLLDSAFGAVEDGEELFAQFMNTLQDPGEKPSAFLHRLQLALNLAVKRGGIPPDDVDKHLLKQFCRGCWDSGLLSSLQLEHKKNCPPSFSELLLMLRTEEDRQAAKVDRMKKHIGSSKRVSVHAQSSCVCAGVRESPQCGPKAIEELQKQIASLQSQLASFASQEKLSERANKKPVKKTTCKSKMDNTHQEVHRLAGVKQTGRPRPWYCFHCGEDGHIATSCTNPANSALVIEKKKQLERRQHAWESQSCPSDSSSPLN